MLRTPFHQTPSQPFPTSPHCRWQHGGAKPQSARQQEPACHWQHLDEGMGDEPSWAPPGTAIFPAVTGEGSNDTQATIKPSRLLSGRSAVPRYPKPRELCPRDTQTLPEWVFSPGALSSTCGWIHKSHGGTFPSSISWSRAVVCGGCCRGRAWTVRHAHSHLELLACTELPLPWHSQHFTLHLYLPQALPCSHQRYSHSILHGRQAAFLPERFTGK